MIKLLIWGTGEQCQEFLNKIEFINEEIVCFIDNDVNKRGTTFYNKKIESPEKIKEMTYDKIIIASTKYHNEILKELLEIHGVKKDSIMSLYEFIAEKLDNKEENLITFKHDSELDFWIKSRGSSTNANAYYQKMFEDICEKDSTYIVKDKIIVDFGCGPMGSLGWAKNMGASLTIGVDVLVDRYWDEFGEELIHHNMLYIKSTEKYIPIPNEFADIVLTINAMDHVNDFERMARENMRILKKGGLFVASFNLNEIRTACEPQNLSVRQIKENIFPYLFSINCRIAYKGSNETYSNFYKKNLIQEDQMDNTKEAIMWLTGIKK